MFYSDNPVKDFLRYDAEQCEKLEQLPKCSECGEPIQDEYCYEINDMLVCEECLNICYRKPIENFI